jgi:hypothetical protein
MHIDPKDLEVVLYERHKEAREVGVDQLEAEVLGDRRILVLRVRLQPNQTTPCPLSFPPPTPSLSLSSLSFHVRQRRTKIPMCTNAPMCTNTPMSTLPPFLSPCVNVAYACMRACIGLS